MQSVTWKSTVTVDRFCYELNNANRPCPKLYYGYSVLPKMELGKRVQVVELSETDPRSLDALQQIYPYIPQQESTALDNAATDPVASLKQQEQHEMTRPVEGFITAQGKFFETEQEANLYEARYMLNAAITNAAKEIGVDGEAHLEQAIEQFTKFINSYENTIRTYLDARRAMAIGSEEQYEMDGQSTSSDQSDDTSVQLKPDPTVDPTPDAKADTKTTGASTKPKAK